MIQASPLWDVWVRAASSLRSDPGRAGGVVLGVAIASGALILLAALAASGQRAIVDATGGEGGAVLLEGFPVPPALGEKVRANRRPIDMADVRLLRKAGAFSGSVVAGRRATTASLSWRGEAQSVRVLAVSTALFAPLGFRAAKGRLFQAADAAAGARVAVLGKKVVERFPKVPLAVGNVVALDGIPFTVVGILDDVPSFSSGNPWDWDNGILITEAAFATNLAAEREGEVERLFVAIERSLAGQVDKLSARLRSLISFRHGDSAGLRLDDGEEGKRKLQMVLGITGALLLVTAAVSLLVSSLNVMNCTLISTVERSYEIGVRRSLGASTADIFWQFMVESLALSLAGAAAGLIAGMLVLVGVTALLASALPGWELRLGLWASVAALVVPIAVSALFTVYPAWRGARLNPVEALRRR
jgi:putative ABC transport system permease protein